MMGLIVFCVAIGFVTIMLLVMATHKPGEWK